MIDISLKINLPSYVGGLYIDRVDDTLKIKRRDKIIEISYPVISSREIKLAVIYLNKYKKQAHDRPILETIEILHQLHDIWTNPNFEFKKEAEEVLSLVTGQSKALINFELEHVLELFQKDHLIGFLSEQFGDINSLDDWVVKNDVLLHAQPRGLILHSLAGNAFVIGPISILFGILTKNLNLIKLASGEPYFAVRFVQTIYDIDRNLARELAVMYWRGREKNIYQFLFNEELIDVVIAWGGLESVRQLKKLSAYYGVKFIEHGPKFSFSIITEDFLNKREYLTLVAREIAKDVSIWNQYACCSPRIVFVQEKNTNNLCEDDSNIRSEMTNLMNQINDNSIPNQETNSNVDSQIISLMSESMDMLRRTITFNTALGFAKLLSLELGEMSKQLARTKMTEYEAIETLNKRDFYTFKIENKGWGKLFIPKGKALTQNPDWTVLYLRRMPNKSDIDACINRFIMVVPFNELDQIKNWIQEMKIQKFLQTFSIIGQMKKIQDFSDLLTLMGGCTITLPGEMNLHKRAAPHDGGFDLKELVRWVSINFFKDNLKKFYK